MLKTTLLHPAILQALASAGHGSRVLIADGNYPFATGAPPTAAKVFLNLMPGVVKVTEVLAALADTIPIESAMVMLPPDGTAPRIHDEFRQMLPPETELTEKKRLDFYSEVKSPDTALVIATGDQRRFANLLLTIGVVKGGGS